jgi:hypothetical protein
LGRCERYTEKDPAPDQGMEVAIQGGQGAGDDIVIFFRGADTDTIENRKRLKLSRKGQLPIWMVQPEQMKVNSQVILS